MSFEKYVLCRKNEDCVVEDLLSKKTYNLNETVELLNSINSEYDELHDKIVQVLTKEYKKTRWKNESANARLQLLTHIARELNIEL